MVECLDAGAADYLLKPLQPQVIKTLFLVNNAMVFMVNRPWLPYACSVEVLHIQAIMETHLPCVSQNNYRPPSKERTALLKQQISNWEFFPIDLDPEDLIFCVVFIFEQVFLCPELAYPSVTQGKFDLFYLSDLYHFILDLSKTYHDQNSYHNFAHAVDVLQSTYYMLCSLGVLTLADRSPSPPKENPTWPQSLLRPKDVFALLIAAIGHDAAHPGVSNIFMINSATPLALLYNDSSVLESFHAMTLFQVMKRHGFDQLAGGAGSPEYQEFRKRVITSILATDMAHHADYVTKIKEQAVRLHSTPLRSMDEATCEKERLLLCSAIIKCADISNVARPYRLAIKWAELLTEEFACQGDLERELSMPVLPFNDREKIILEDSQIGFIQYVAMDLFSSVAGVMHEITFAVKQMQQNLKQWQNRKSVLHDSGVSSLGDTDDSGKQITYLLQYRCLICHVASQRCNTPRSRVLKESSYWIPHASFHG
ncbi:hypothetical protein BDF14DRAFT_1733954 [Spinellus fusiger]|nr:hypothetical protein BDF14DRAFT_1733954 [Spinellus fusiger]